MNVRRTVKRTVRRTVKKTVRRTMRRTVSVSTQALITEGHKDWNSHCSIY